MRQKLELTQTEIILVHDLVVDRYLRQRDHVRSQEEPSDRAYDILDTLQDLKGRLSDMLLRYAI